MLSRRAPGRASLLPLLATALIVFGACSAAATPAPTAAPATPAPTAAPATPAPVGGTGGVVPGDSRFATGPDGGTITVAYVGPCCVGVDNNNPMSEGGDYEWTHLIYEHLNTNSVNPITVDKNPFGGAYSGDLVPELADSWEVSSDHLTWTFHLHPGIKWTDGTDFTSADVKYSFELCLDPKVGACYPGGSFGSVITGGGDVKDGKTQELTGVQAPDALTVTIQTDTPQALIPFLVQDLFIVQKASVSKIAREEMAKTPYWSTPGQVIGTGPFIVSAYTPGQSMEVVRNINYWRGKPHLDGIIRKEFKDAATALLAFDKGEVDVTYVEAGEVERELTSTIGTILPGPSGVDRDLTLNPNKIKDFADKRVRQAFLYAIDRASILKNVYHIEDAGLNCLYLNPAFNPDDVAKYPYDPEKAKALLAEAGVDPASWGEIVFDTYYGDQDTLDAMTVIQQNLADVGIKVKIQQMDSASWSDRYYGKGSAPGESVMSMIGGDGGGAAAAYGNGTLNSANAYPKGGNGWNGYHWVIPELDKALEAVLNEFDPVARVGLIQNVCRIDAVEQPYLNLWATTRYWFVNNRVGNFVNSPGPGMGNYYKAAEQWFIRP